MEVPSESNQKYYALTFMQVFLENVNSWSDKLSQSRPPTALSAGLIGKKIMLNTLATCV